VLTKWLSMAACAAIALSAGAALAQTANKQADGKAVQPLRIGVLTDMSGPYADVGGSGTVEAVKMAVGDFGGSVLGRPVEVVWADHQNKPDIASAIARKWFDTEGVDMITDLTGSASALAVTEVARQFGKIAIANGASSSTISGAKCTAFSLQYTSESYSLSKATGTSIVKQGGDTWFFLTADYAFGHDMEETVSNIVRTTGGKVLGAVRHPINTADFSSYLLQAQSSGAKIIALANAGADTANAMKTAREFGTGTTGKQRLAGLLVFISDIHSAGLETAQDLRFTTAWYWDRDDATRQWAERYFQRVGRMPEMTHAGNYSSTMHYLQAVKAAGTDDGAVVIKQMKDTPIDDFFAHGGKIRADGLMVHDLYLAQVKKPAESKRPWDYLNILAVIPKDEAYRPLSESACPLVRK
jgi:branched-chain amino acid transport system substrate-binding protein